MSVGWPKQKIENCLIRFKVGKSRIMPLHFNLTNSQEVKEMPATKVKKHPKTDQ